MGRFKCILLSLAVVLLLTGCGMRTVEDMYCLPRRPEDYGHLQTAIQNAMVGLQYAAPLSGENQQSLQMADLTGDGVSEYLLFAKSETEEPLRILIFRQSEDGYAWMTTIKSQGTAFDRVEYVDMDGVPGVELVVGCRVSDEIMGDVSVYTFPEGDARPLLRANYEKFLTCDLESDGYSELMLLRSGESDAQRGIAVLYDFRNGEVGRSAEVELSGGAAHIKRIMAGTLYGGTPAVYVASSADGNAIVTDIFAMKDGVFTNISFSNESGTSVRTLRNYYVYADDIDDDGTLELPSLITMATASGSGQQDRYMIRWFAMDPEGREVDKLYTYHNFAGGWYLCLGEDWATQITAEQNAGVHAFYVWDASQQSSVPVFTIYALTGQDRDTAAVEDGKFLLLRTENVVYAATLEASAGSCGITQEYLINAFRLIQKDWNTGET